MIARTYQDLLDEIQYYDLRIKQLNREKRKLYIQTFHGPSGYSSNSGADITGIRATLGCISLDRGIERIKFIENEISECESMMMLIQDQLKEINELLYSLTGRKYKIFYMHRCENKSYKDIAKEIGLSACQVQRIYKEVTNENE